MSPSIDMIELIAARGNSSLESAVSLARSIKLGIQRLGVRLSRAAVGEEMARRGSTKAQSLAQSDIEVKLIIKDIRDLLEQVQDAIPLLHLAVTTSGVSLSSSLPATVSPSRLLQASTFLSAGDSGYSMQPKRPAQIGPTFILSMYMLFLGHAGRMGEEDSRRTAIWKEVVHKTHMKLVRVPIHRARLFPFATQDTEDGQEPHEDGESNHQMPAEAPSHEFAYQLSIIENLSDDRVHTFDDETFQPEPLDDVAVAGIREVIPIHEVSKTFYADTGKLLNIGSDGESNSPILLIKRDPNAPLPRQMMPDFETELDEDSRSPSGQKSTDSRDHECEDESSQIEAQIRRESSSIPEPGRLENSEDLWRLPAGLDPEWIAFEVYSEATESDNESDLGLGESDQSSSRPHQGWRQGAVDPNLTSSLSKLDLNSETSTPLSQKQHKSHLIPTPHHQSLLPTDHGPVKTSLSLLEMLIRLASAQQFQQCSHLAITDELLNFFLQESSTTGTGSGDSENRKKARLEAAKRLGWDPYDESPIKHHGEEYQYRGGEQGAYGYDDDWDPTQQGSSSPFSSSVQDTQSPLLLRSREHSSQSRTGTPEPQSLRRSYSTPQTRTPPPCGDYTRGVAQGTSPRTTKSRQAFLRDEAAITRPAIASRGSPLARQSSNSPEKSEP